MLQKLKSRRALWIAAVVLTCLIGVGYRPLSDWERWPEPDAQINPDFRRHPPIAQEIHVQLLDTPMPSGANAILSAHFDSETVKRIHGKYLAMRLQQHPSKGAATPALDYLRDDGYDGDLKPEDGWYTKSFQLNKTQQADLFAKLEAMQSSARLPHNGWKFVGRQMVLNADRSSPVVQTNNEWGTLLTFYPSSSVPIATPNFLFPDHSLMITDLSVIEDPTRTYNPCTNVGNPNGVWTFGELMRQLASPNPSAIANDAQTIAFIRGWLNTYSAFQTINGEVVSPRSVANILNDWSTLSVNNGASPGNLLLENVPFRLLAIVNRIDLREANGYGFNNAGEARFVFCLVDANCAPQRFTVIFEYGVDKTDCAQVHDYALQWAKLSDIHFGDPAYNNALENLTSQFSLCGANPSNPNQSSLNQLRTNEAALGNPLWELREFNLSPSMLVPTTVKQEPAVKYNVKINNSDVQLLAGWVNANTAAIVANNYTVPLTVSGFDFLGGQSHTPSPTAGPPMPGTPPTPHHWDGDPNPGPAHITDKDARHIFSLNTCSGCHGGETQTVFTHVNPAGFGAQPILSQFLTGDPLTPPNTPFMVPDAAGRPSYSAPEMRGFNDLWRRALDLQLLLESSCDPMYVAISSLSTQVIQNPH